MEGDGPGGLLRTHPRLLIEIHCLLPSKTFSTALLDLLKVFLAWM